MAQLMNYNSICIMIMAMLAMAEATPPGIAKNPSQTTCTNGKYKYCVNLVHVCPQFCPDSCHTDCVSCKPVCNGSTTAPSPSDSGSLDTETPDSESPPTTSTLLTTPTPLPHLQINTRPAPWHPPSPPRKRRSRCRNKKYPRCYNVEHVCPDPCTGGCRIKCASCTPVCNCDLPGAVCQDPRFVGGDGITFYFHGKKDKDFCLVSDSNIHINGHFIGKRNSNLTRDFTWVQSIGILFGNHKLFIGAKKTATWNDAIDRLALAFDGKPIFLPSKQGVTWKSEITPSVSIARADDTNVVIVEVEGNFKITAKAVPITKEDSRVHNYGITEEDCFAHLDLGFKFYSLSNQVNGILGQTYGSDYMSKVKVGAIMPVMGGEKKFSSSTLFSTDCSVSQFSRGALALKSEIASLNCSSRMDGAGVMCKR